MDASTLVDELLESEELTALLATDPYGPGGGGVSPAGSV